LPGHTLRTKTTKSLKTYHHEDVVFSQDLETNLDVEQRAEVMLPQGRAISGPDGQIMRRDFNFGLIKEEEF
jgi:hypothetical protein